MSSKFRYFEDYQVGQKGGTATRTVTEADVVNFACLTEDYATVHLDRHGMESNFYRGRVAHGLLDSSLVTGMLSLWAPHILGRGVPGAYFYSFDANYPDAIRLGDTVHVQWNITEKADDPDHPGFGIVKTAFQLVNQTGVSADDGTVTTLVRKESSSDVELRLIPGEPWQINEYVPEPGKEYAREGPIGTGRETDGRTITETDIVNYAGLTGDYSPIHVDAEFARKSMFGERIAHGWMVFAIAYGRRVTFRNALLPAPRSIGRGGFAGHINDKSTFIAPVKIGDTIRCRYKTLSIRPSKSRPEAIVVTIGLQVINQRNEVVQNGSTTNMDTLARWQGNS